VRLKAGTFWAVADGQWLGLHRRARRLPAYFRDYGGGMKGVVFSTQAVHLARTGEGLELLRSIRSQPTEALPFLFDDESGEWYQEGGTWHARPFYRVGEVCYVKESWAISEPDAGGGFLYRADSDDSMVLWRRPEWMPEVAARFWLTIIGVRPDCVDKSARVLWRYSFAWHETIPQAHAAEGAR
jgi:hypothetical protein